MSLAATIAPDAVYRKVTWRLLPFLFICYIAAYLDRVNVGFAKLQMNQALSLSETVYGLGAGVFFIGYFLFEVPSNIFLHRVGARRWIARIMISWGVLSAAMMFTSGPISFYVLRFLLGAAEAGFFPGIILYLTYWYPAEQRGRITALFMTAVAISGVVGGPISGWILQYFNGIAGLAGWQWLFVLEGIPSIAIGLWVPFYLDDRIGDAGWLAPEEKALLEHRIAADNAHKVEESVGLTLASGRVWLKAAIYFCLVCGLYGVGFWLPTIIAAMGIKNAFDVGLLSAIPYAVATVGMVLVGRSADRSGERRWHVAVPAALGGLGLVLSVVFAGNTVLALASLSLATFGIIAALPLFWSLPTAFLRGAAAAAGIALINSVGNLAGFLSPYAVGWIKDTTQSTAAGMYGLAVVLFVGAGLVIAFVPKPRVD